MVGEETPNPQGQGTLGEVFPVSGSGSSGLSLTTWWQLNSFITEASLRNSILSRMLAASFTVLMATLVSGSSLTTPLATPSYTIPKEPCPNSRLMVIFSRATSHSSGTYTREEETRTEPGQAKGPGAEGAFGGKPKNARCHSLKPTEDIREPRHGSS